MTVAQGVSSTVVHLHCDACGELVEGDSGWIVVDLDDVMARERAWREHGELNAGRAHSVAEILALPRRIEWHAWHRACDPDPDSNAYYIELARMRTWPDVVQWTAHLMEKTWLPSTNWDDVLRGLVAGNGTLRWAA